MKKSENIRVAIVVASIDILGGQAIQALRLMEGLGAEPGIEAELLPINPRLPKPLRWLQRIKYVRTVVTSIAYIASLLVRLTRFDVVHVFSASYFSFVLAPTPAVLISKLYGKPVLLNYHSGEAEDHLRRWPRTALPVLRLADRVVVPSDYLVKVFAAFGVKAEAVFNTVDSSRFQFRERRALKPVLLSNRNLEPHYNVACTLRAFATIQTQVAEARLIVAGDGSERRYLRELAGELQLNNVDFVGAVAPERMPPLYDRADIFVNASNIDNQPLSIIEAFASGLPVVTTGAGGIRDMISDGITGLMVSCDDHAALADRVLSLLSDDELASRIAGRAREECKNYSWAAVRNQWLTIYRELAPANDALRCKPVQHAESSGRM
ncbi:MAG TPA: glycosyltransferase family 4 protein [Blastocatellia bacterium]|nr:glycosyltransferase family 4 protein [Blastocatellia bacterium]